MFISAGAFHPHAQQLFQANHYAGRSLKHLASALFTSQ
jgi:hypothetical protein